MAEQEQDIFLPLKRPRTPSDVIARVAAEVAKIAADPAVSSRLASLGVEAVGMPAEPFDAYWRQQLDHYRAIVSQSNISLGQ